MHLSDLIRFMTKLDLGRAGAWHRPPREQIRELQEAVRCGLEDEAFVLDCIEADLPGVERWIAAGARTRTPPIATLDDQGLVVRLSHWHPGMFATPHEHTSWTMSAVFQNHLEVVTYSWERALDQQRLEIKNRFTAAAGQVGYVYEPCIHSPRNPSKSFSSTFHIYNWGDRRVLEQQVGPIEGMHYNVDETANIYRADPGDLNTDPLASLHQAILRSHATVAARFPSDRGAALLEKIYAKGDRRTRAQVAASLKVFAGPEWPAQERRLLRRAS